MQYYLLIEKCAFCTLFYKGIIMKKLFYVVLFSLVSTGVFASCNVTSGTINILANEFATLRILME